MSPKRGLQQNLREIIHRLTILKSIVGKGAKVLPPRTSVPGPIVKPSGARSASSDTFNARFWKKLSFFGALPIIAVVGTSVLISITKGSEKERKPFVKYEYLRLRSKRFPWGDGTKSFFHNPETNPLPDGYEDEL